MRESKRVREAKRKALEIFDRILDVYEERDFVEVWASVGGDFVVRRYYNDGREFDR